MPPLQDTTTRTAVARLHLQAEAFLCQTDAKRCSSTLHTQNITAAPSSNTVAAKLPRSVVLLDSTSLQPQQSFTAPLLPDGAKSTAHTNLVDHTSILGLSINPTGTHIAAYTADQLFCAAAAAAAAAAAGAAADDHTEPSRVVQQQRQQQPTVQLPQQQQQALLGRLAPVAVLPEGIRSIQWSQSGRVLAVCCKNKAEVKLFELTGTAAQSGGGSSSSSSNSSIPQLVPVLTLPGPPGAARGPTAAAWVSSASGDSTSSTSSDSSSSNGQVPTAAAAPAAVGVGVIGLLVAWPNNSLLLHTWQVPPSQATGCIDWGSSKTHNILTGWPGPVRSLLTLQPPLAGLSTGTDKGQSDASSSSSSTSLVCIARVVATVDAAPAWQLATSNDSIGPQQQNGMRSTDQGLLAAAVRGGADEAPAVSTAVGLGGPAGSNDGSSSSVLDSLMNISSTPQQQQQHSRGVALLQPVSSDAAVSGGVVAPTPQQASLTNSSSSNPAALQQQAPSYLCLLTLDLAWIDSKATGAAGGSSSGAGSISVDVSRARQPDPAAAAAAAAGGQVVTPYVSVLPLPEQPLPSFLAAQGQHLVAVGSSTGAPRVTLCAVNDTTGLQVLQTVAVPLPKAVADVTAAAAAAGEERGSAASSSADSHHQTAGVPGSGSSSSSKQARLQGLLLVPNDLAAAGRAPSASSGAAGYINAGIVALVACLDRPAHPAVGFFGGGLFGGSSNAKGSSTPAAPADVYILRLALGGQEEQKEVPRQQKELSPQQQSVGISNSSSDSSQAVVAALKALQVSLEGRLDSMQQTLQRMDARLQALERRGVL